MSTMQSLCWWEILWKWWLFVFHQHHYHHHDTHHHQHQHHHDHDQHHWHQHHQDHDQHHSIIASASSASLSGNGGISRSASEGSLQENLSYRNSDHTILIFILIIIIITSITCTANAILITISFLFSHLLDTPLFLSAQVKIILWMFQLSFIDCHINQGFLEWCEPQADCSFGKPASENATAKSQVTDYKVPI